MGPICSTWSYIGLYGIILLVSEFSEVVETSRILIFSGFSLLLRDTGMDTVGCSLVLSGSHAPIRVCSSGRWKLTEAHNFLVLGQHCPQPSPKGNEKERKTC